MYVLHNLQGQFSGTQGFIFALKSASHSTVLYSFGTGFHNLVPRWGHQPDHLLTLARMRQNYRLTNWHPSYLTIRSFSNTVMICRNRSGWIDLRRQEQTDISTMFTESRSWICSIKSPKIKDYKCRVTKLRILNCKMFN